VAAGILFRSWDSEERLSEAVETVEHVEPYQRGLFYKRELPCLLKVLGHFENRFHTVIIDGYVWLDADHRPGLGYHLYAAMERPISVVGVAKNPFRGSPHAERVLRGRSKRPLYVTSVGLDVRSAAKNIAAMRGYNRIPTMLKRVDRLCRDSASLMQDSSGIGCKIG
jgi:deoxyribonuclease V